MSPWCDISGWMAEVERVLDGTWSDDLPKKGTFMFVFFLQVPAWVAEVGLLVWGL